MRLRPDASLGSRTQVLSSTNFFLSIPGLGRGGFPTLLAAALGQPYRKVVCPDRLSRFAFFPHSIFSTSSPFLTQQKPTLYLPMLSTSDLIAKLLGWLSLWGATSLFFPEIMHAWIHKPKQRRFNPTFPFLSIDTTDSPL